MPRCLTLLLLLTASAQAAIIRGKVTTALGVPAPGTRIQLILLSGGSRSVSDTIAGVDGRYELRTDLAGRFLLLLSPSLTTNQLAPQIGEPFYAGRTDFLTRDIALDAHEITPQLSTLTTLRDLPLAQQSTPITQFRPDQILTHATLIPTLRQTPSVTVTQFGPTGAPALVSFRGGPSAATQFLVDGIPAESLGGAFNLATLSPTGLAAPTNAPAIELIPTPIPFNTIDAESSAIALHTSLASSLRAALQYAGDAGNLAAVRNEVLLTAAPKRADLAAGFSRFDTDSGSNSPFHLATGFANLGYHLSAGTSVRATARQDVSAAPQASPFDFYKLQPQDKQSAQNLYATFAFATITNRNWANQGTYGLTRKRTQLQTFSTPVAGLPVTITGANGYTATGIAAFPAHPGREDLASNRDTFTYETGYPFKPWLAASFQARFEDERGADQLPASKLTVERHHLNAALGLSGNLIRHRVFYEASGFLDYSTLFHTTGAPRLGLTYVPIRPGHKPMHGTTLHATLAAGLREPTLNQQAQVPNAAAPNARTFDLTVDQQILTKLTLRATYFHNQFAHEFEATGLTSESQTLALRTQGLESTLNYNPLPRLSLRATYTYLAALTEQSATPAVFNPLYPNVRVGQYSALAGARPFHRPPNSGTARIDYTGRILNASLQAASTGRSDDTTALAPQLLLLNRNLSPGYTDVSANVSIAFSRRITAYTQLTNLFDDRHMAPIGYTSAPFLIRTGLRIRLGGE